MRGVRGVHPAARERSFGSVPRRTKARATRSRRARAHLLVFFFFLYFIFYSFFLFLSSVLWRPVRADAAIELVVAEVSPACGWLTGRLIVGRRRRARRRCIVMPHNAPSRRITRHASHCPTARCMEPQLLRGGRQHERSESSSRCSCCRPLFPSPRRSCCRPPAPSPRRSRAARAAPAPPSTAEHGLQICVGA